MASERKSWSFTRSGERSHLTPEFLKLPTSSRFLVPALKLLVAIRAGTGGQLFAIEVERVVHAVKQAGYGVGGDGDACLLEQLSDLVGSLASPSRETPPVGDRRRVPA